MSDYIVDESGPDAAPLERVEQLVEHIDRGSKPRDQWRIGTEYEKPAVDPRTGGAIPFSGPRGVEAVLRALAEGFGWEPTEENGRTIGLTGGGGSITLEPGGQIELSGRPCVTLHESKEELDQHVRELTDVGDDLNVAFLGLGAQPFTPLDAIEWVPKKRYGIMGPYMTEVGKLGQRMMKQTATVQVNVDFESERDAMQKMRVSTGIGPLINAIFANSPITEGQKNGFMSYRGHVWTDTDPSRCGILPFLFDASCGFEEYVDWALDAPMYFIKRRGDYLNMTGIPFRSFWKEGAGEERATVGDFALHLSTLFPETRLKTYIELRMADSQPPELLLALSAIAKGILYESDCMTGAWDLVKGWSIDEREEAWREAPKTALETRFRRHRFLDFARELVEIAMEGLRRQDCRSDDGHSETVYLEPVVEMLRAGECPATRLLSHWDADPTHPPERLVDFARYRR